MKKVLALLLPAVIVLCLIPAVTLPIFAEQSNDTGAMELRYDDHVNLTGKTVEIIDAGVPTSYQVGYGIEANQVQDTAVVTLEGTTLVATGTGTAQVKIDGVVRDVKVSAAPISMLFLLGQSNMQGSEGNANQSIVCEDGQVYSTYGDRYTMNTSNATNFAPSALTGTGSAVNVNGTTTNLKDWPVYLLNAAGAGKAGPDSGFGYEWAKQTGEKVWVINAAHGGSAISSWQKNGANYKEAVLLFKACQETMRKEIAAGHFTLSHMAYFWCQGCSDYSASAQWYVEQYLNLHNNLKTDLAFSEDKTFEMAGIIPVRAGREANLSYREGVYTDTTTKDYYQSFKDLRFTGPRVAQYWMANNPELPDIWNVCNIGEDWVYMPDGTNGVAAYFQANYPGGKIDYTPQVKQKAAWYTPTTPAAVHDSIHYNQIGYNEVGRVAARNALIILDEIEAPEEETSVKFYNWTGYQEATDVKASVESYSKTLVVPVVYPCYRSKEVRYQVSEGLSYTYYDLTAQTTQTTGKITAVGADGSVNVLTGHTWSDWEAVTEPSVEGPGWDQRICSNCGEVETRTVRGVWQTLNLSAHMAPMPEHYCFKTNLWAAMEHDEYYFASGTNWGIHSSQDIWSVTIPVTGGDRIFASCFVTGMRTTFFDKDGVLISLTASKVVSEYNKNGYLTAPAGAVAVNISMSSNSNDWEIYILNREHCYDNGTCLACGDHIGPVITQRPVYEEVALGENYRITVQAEGEGLKYQWYIRNAGDENWYASAVRSGRYAGTLTKARVDREVYCIITDADGNQVRTQTVKLTCKPAAVTIVTQPTSVAVALGESYRITVQAKGDGLKYQWYIRNAGSDQWVASAVRSGKYTGTLTKARVGREVYCEITDAYGNQVRTDVVKISRAPDPLTIVTQPESVSAAMGEACKVSVKAQGEGLKYQWYIRNAGDENWYASAIRSANYSLTMTKARANREVYCVITDAYGNQVKSETVMLRLEN